MASLLRKIVAGPRSRHAEADLDLCYVTDQIIATSGPSSTYPQLAYRNPLDDLVKFLQLKHKDKWAIWEFRAEGTGYPDEEVFGRIWHYPWPDHHPPPFALIPSIMASMRNWLHADKDNIVVVHCKAGKGRSGTASCSYLISECDWKPAEALARFTERRMRSGFGQGVSIPSQLRWIDYVERWTQHGKLYVERQIEILEVHVWGLRDGVKVSIEGYVEEGRVIKTFHVFRQDERIIVDGNGNETALDKPEGPVEEEGKETLKPAQQTKPPPQAQSAVPSKRDRYRGSRDSSPAPSSSSSSSSIPNKEVTGTEAGGRAVIFRPSSNSAPIVLPTNDINVDFERRNKAAYGWTMVTAVAHVWFNAFFEAGGPAKGEENGKWEGAETGVFEIDWDKMDGIKGSSRKGTRALDRVAVLWRVWHPPSEPDPTATTDPITRSATATTPNDPQEKIIEEPAPGAPVPQMRAANWKGTDKQHVGGEEDQERKPPAPVHLHHHLRESDADRDLGLRTESPASANISKANSVHSVEEEGESGGVKIGGVVDAAISKAKHTTTATGTDDDADGEERGRGASSSSAAEIRASEPNLEEVNRGLDTASQTTPLEPLRPQPEAETEHPAISTTASQLQASTTTTTTTTSDSAAPPISPSQPAPDLSAPADPASSKPHEVAGALLGALAVRPEDLPGGKPAAEMHTAGEGKLGRVRRAGNAGVLGGGSGTGEGEGGGEKGKE